MRHRVFKAVVVTCLVISWVNHVSCQQGSVEEDEDAVVQNEDELENEQLNENANELLREVVRYGLDQSQFISEVEERELYDEGIRLRKTNPAHFVAIFNKQKKRAKELSQFAYASLEASSLLTRQFNLTRQQVVYGLERVELRQTDLFQRCPNNNRVPRQTACPPASHPYRTADGSCNNLARPEWGTSFAPFLRFLPPVYGDALGNEFRRPVRQNNRNNRELPSPRLISSEVHRDSSAETAQFSMMVMQWGQFLDHDITFTPQKRGFNDSLIKCCNEDGSPLPPGLRHRDCKPIEISTRDPFYAQHNRTCMDFVRSTPATKADCSLGFRDQLNQVTSFIDASNIYGSTEEEERELRLFESGKLRYTDLHFRKSLLPPLEQNKADEECRISTPNLHCFHAGDGRVNEQPGLAGMHTLWLREHNRLARRLQEINPHWSDEITYQEARKIVGAMQQHITYNEWLPIVLGPRVLDIFELRLSPRGHYSGYNESVNPTIANAFASAAMRFGHSLIKNTLARCDRVFNEVAYFVRLHKELNNPANLHNFGSVDRILLGLVSKTMARRDEFITTEVTQHLFQNPRTAFGMDLAALNIQRGRDHGLAPYNIWREQCGLSRFRRFTDMIDVISSSTIRRLEQVYDSVDDIDLFTGGLAERPVVGGLVGPTFACILGQQFLNLRKGDRFWYENSNVFTLDQLLEIRKTTLARTMCDNLDDIETIQPYAFLMIDDTTNRRVSCKARGRIPRMNLERWREGPSSKTEPEPTVAEEEPIQAFQPYSQTLDETLAAEADSEVPVKPEFAEGWNSLTDQEQDKPEFYSFGLIRQADVPPLVGDASDFTVEVPKQLTRDQYFTFFEKHAFINAANDLEAPPRVAEIPFFKGRRLETALNRQSMALRRKFVKKLFTELLKPSEDDADAHLRPNLV